MVEPTNVDSHKLMFHPERVSEFREKGDCYPIYIEVGLTNACNHKCIFCALDYLENGGTFIDKDILISNLRIMAEKGVKSIMFAGEGEPLMHKDVGLFVKKAKESGIDVSITTNGILFNQIKIEECLPHLSWARFSIDAATPENYSKIHGTKKEDFDKLMDNLRETVLFRNKNALKTTIGTQFLMISENLDEAVELAKNLKKIGVDNLQIKPYSHHPKSLNDFSVKSADSDALREEIMKLDSDNFKVLFRKSTLERIQEGIDYPECYGLPFFALVDSKGNIMPCNLYYGNPDFIYGNLYEKNFHEIWESEKRKEIIKKLKEKGVENCRKGCRLDVINRYLHRLKNPLPHDNFI